MGRLMSKMTSPQQSLKELMDIIQKGTGPGLLLQDIGGLRKRMKGAPKRGDVSIVVTDIEGYTGESLAKASAERSYVRASGSSGTVMGLGDSFLSFVV